jgi:opacity protein-like surface antigen
MRAILTVVLVVCAASASAQDLSNWYARAEGGQAVAVSWAGARVGRTLGRGLAVDVGVGGTPEGRGSLSLTGAVEARALERHRVSVFTRAEAGLLASASGESYLVLGLGGGLAVRLDPKWSLRAGFSRSLNIGDVVLGPDYAYVGIEHRW